MGIKKLYDAAEQQRMAAVKVRSSESTRLTAIRKELIADGVDFNSASKTTEGMRGSGETVDQLVNVFQQTSVEELASAALADEERAHVIQAIRCVRDSFEDFRHVAFGGGHEMFLQAKHRLSNALRELSPYASKRAQHSATNAPTKIDKRNDRLKELVKKHGIANEWAKLATIANEDPLIEELGFAGKITRDIVRNVLNPRKKKRQR